MVICWELMGISWDFTVSIAGIKRHIKHNQSSTVYLLLPMTDPWCCKKNANIWGILMVHVTIYTSTMDPMGYGYHSWFFQSPKA